MDATINNPEEINAVQEELISLKLPLDTVESVRGQETTDTNLSGLSGDKNDSKLLPKRPEVYKPLRTVQALVRHSRYLSKLRDSESKQKSVKGDTARLPSRQARSRLFKRFIRQAEPLGFRDTVDGVQDYNNVQVHTAYDTTSWNVSRPHTIQIGPLASAFNFYAKLLDPKIATGSYYPTFEAIERAARTCTFTECLAFAWDFDIVPHLLSRGDLRYVFAYVQRDSEDYINELTYEQFEEFLARVSLVAYEKTIELPVLPGEVREKDSIVLDSEGNPIFTRRRGEDGGDDEKKLPRPRFHIDTSWRSKSEEEALNVKVEVLSPTKKVKKLIRELGLSNTEYVKNIIENKGKTTAGRLNGTIKLNSPRDNDGESQMNRLLRKRDGAMCDYTAPKIMNRRNKCRREWREGLTKPFHPLRQLKGSADVWKGYHAPLLYLGRVLTKKKHRYRIVVRNPMRDAITIEVERYGCDFLTLEYARSPIPSGLTVNVIVDSYIENPGEYAGYLKIKWRLYKVEVVARKKPRRASADVDAGSFTVPVFGNALHRRNFGSENAECSCPVVEFQNACTQPCPRYYLPPDHPVHRYEKPIADGMWQRTESKFTTGRQTRDTGATILPRPGSKQMERMKDFAKSPPKRGRHTDSTYTTGTDSQRGTQSDGSRLINASTSKDGEGSSGL